jgi:hypothetical protein
MVSDEQTQPSFADVLAAIQIHGEDLIKTPNVLIVRPGYRFRDGRFIPEPVVSITVLRKVDPDAVPAHELIPTHLGKVSVDVIPATPQQQLAFLRRREAFGLQFLPGEISKLLPGEAATLAGAENNDPPLAAMTLNYVPPTHPLSLVDKEMTVTCHASPDAGWRNLREFIAGTQQRLISTMYEFNARHILDALTTTLKEPRELQLILDGGSPNDVPGPPQTTVSKLAARETLANSLQGRFQCVWAPVRDDHMTTNSFFPSAYHTKVSVRDGNSFWLSSGNWKDSGQPSIDPIKGPLPAGFSKSAFQSKYNREWHVIVHNPELAETFETFIIHDITQAKPLQLPAPPLSPTETMPDLFIPVEGLSAFGTFESEPQFFLEESFTKQIRVQPLMTPDNFPEQVLPLIKDAQRSLYYQNQALKPSAGNSRYMPLFNAVRDKTIEAKTNPNLDVKILVSEYTDLNVLTASNFDMSRVKRQYQCHNKGIIIDDEIVIVGSHNWTGQGATQNRDASLIFFDAEIAAYFKKLFLYDWNRIGANDSLLLSMPLVAMPGEETPEGMIRVPWTTVFTEWREISEAD